jgi:hypothetical protein
VLHFRANFENHSQTELIYNFFNGRGHFGNPAENKEKPQKQARIVTNQLFTAMPTLLAISEAEKLQQIEEHVNY